MAQKEMDISRQLLIATCLSHLTQRRLFDLIVLSGQLEFHLLNQPKAERIDQLDKLRFLLFALLQNMYTLFMTQDHFFRRADLLLNLLLSLLFLVSNPSILTLYISSFDLLSTIYSIFCLYYLKTFLDEFEELSYWKKNPFLFVRWLNPFPELIFDLLQAACQILSLLCCLLIRKIQILYGGGPTWSIVLLLALAEQLLGWIPLAEERERAEFGPMKRRFEMLSDLKHIFTLFTQFDRLIMSYHWLDAIKS